MPCSQSSKIDLINKLSIVQGLTFEKLDLLFPGDVSLYIPRADIRRRWRYKEEGQDPIISFTFLPLLYDADTDKTLVRPRLTALETAGLPVTGYQGKGEPTEATAYVWDLKLEDFGTGRVIGIEWGWVQVKPEATE